MSTLQAMEFRYATKKFDSTKKIEDEKLKSIFEAINLSPTSYGLQLFKVFHIQSETLRASLQPASWNQSQVVDAAEFLIFAANKEFNPSDVDALMQRNIETRGMSQEQANGYGDFIKAKLSEMGDYFPTWTSRQPYIALGNAMTVAAELGIDSCPMEGFDTEAVSKILNLEKTAYQPVVMLALGYRSNEDSTKDAPKVRKPINELIETL